MSLMFKTHAATSFLFVHTQCTKIRTTLKTTITTAAAATKAGPFSSFHEPFTGAP